MKFKKIDFYLFLCLVSYWIAAIFLIIFLISLGVAILFYLRSGNVFYFDWPKELFYAIKKSLACGSILGAGIWIKAKLQENKNKKGSDR